MASYISGYFTCYTILILLCLKKWSIVYTQSIGPPDMSPSQALKLRSPMQETDSTRIPSIRGVPSRQPSIVMLSQMPADVLKESRSPPSGNDGTVKDMQWRRPSDFDRSLQTPQLPDSWARQEEIPTPGTPAVPTNAFNQQNFPGNPVENAPTANQLPNNFDHQFRGQRGTSSAEGPDTAANTLRELSAMIDRLQTLEERLLKLTADSKSGPPQRNNQPTFKSGTQNRVSTTTFPPTTTPYVPTTTASWQNLATPAASNDQRSFVPRSFPKARTVPQVDPRPMFGQAVSSGSNPPFEPTSQIRSNPSFSKERSSRFDSSQSSGTNRQVISIATNRQFGSSLSSGTNRSFGTAISSGTNPQLDTAFSSGTFTPARTGRTNPSFGPAVSSGTNPQLDTAFSSGTIPAFTTARNRASGTNPSFGQSRFSRTNPQFSPARSRGWNPTSGQTFSSGTSPTFSPAVPSNSRQTFASPNFMQPMPASNNQRTFHQGAGANTGGTYPSSNPFVISTPLPPSEPQASNQGTISLQDLLLLSAMNNNNQASSQTRESEFINAMMLMNAMPSSGQSSVSGTASGGSPPAASGMSSFLYSVALGNAMTGASGNNLFDAERMTERMFRQ